VSGRSRQPPAAARRRALAVDLLVAAAIAAVAIALAAGVGVLGFVALPVLLAGLAWVGLEALVSRLRARRRLS
jgi:hypothetical protein